MMLDFLSVILKKEEGRVGAGISILIVKVNVSLSSPDDKSMPHVSGNIAAFHSDLNLDKPKHFLKSHLWDQLTDSLILFTGAVPKLFHTCHSLALSDGLPVCCSVRGFAPPGSRSFRSSGCGLHGCVEADLLSMVAGL